MSAYKITDTLTKEINKDKYNFIVVNIVNGDMVGHTGIIKACNKAIKTVDQCLKKIVQAGLKNEYNMLIFADQGNIEDQTRLWRTSHTINPVPCILVSNDPKLRKRKLKKGKGQIF